MPTNWTGYQGPVRHGTAAADLRSSICADCGERTEHGAWWCNRCKDPDGFLARLESSLKAARQRCLEAYPVCQRCGVTLPKAFVQAGRTTHDYSNVYGCQMPDAHVPLARRRGETG